MALLALIIAELFLGCIVGFILSDNKSGLSVEEIKLSSILFLLANAFVFWKNPDAPGIIFAHLCISWFILIVGVLAGEAVKMRLIHKIVSTIRKKDIQITINELVAIASSGYVKRFPDSKERLHEKLQEVHKMLKQLKEYSKDVQNYSFLRKIDYLQELCDSYVKLSLKVWNSCEEGSCDKELLAECSKIGQELTSISWDTLNHAEENVKMVLGKAFSWKVVRKAFRS